MKLQFTHHAEYRIFYERNISAEDIKKVLSKPDEFEHLEDGLVKAKKLVKKKTLIVVYSKNKKGVYIIITAYFNN
mgnify:CR=1 FL=1